jgi:glycosyltransferase involved in cell wall biosynthesis
MKNICVIGLPSLYGGADTELLDAIKLWAKMGVKVYIIPTSMLDKNALKIKEQLERDNLALYLQPNNWSQCEGLDVISYCNGQFLEALPEIKRYARTTTFVNCMTWCFQKEKEMQCRGLIDFHLYQTEHQFEKICPQLNVLGSVYRPIYITPYFDSSRFPFWENRPTDKFRFGRISRCDLDKYSPEQLSIYEYMGSPVPKEGMILGWDNRTEEYFARKPPEWIRTYSPGEISQQAFYEFVSVLIMSTRTFENLPVVGKEAMSSGSVIIADKRGGWTKLVEHGKTGWLCENEREMVYYASRAAHEQDETQQFRLNARVKLEQEYGLEASFRSWESFFNELSYI